MTTKKYAATLIRSPKFCKESMFVLLRSMMTKTVFMTSDAFTGPVTISKNNPSRIILPGFIVQTNMPKGIFQIWCQIYFVSIITIICIVFYL